jgi:hypothetical protein
VPETGSLAVPIQAEGFGSMEWAFFNSTHFGFNYETKEVKLPVYGGKLQFKLGTKPVEVSFPYDGIYRVSFSSDWNDLKSISYVSDLPAQYLIPPRKPTAIESALNLLSLIFAAHPIYMFSKTAIRKVKEA